MTLPEPHHIEILSCSVASVCVRTPWAQQEQIRGTTCRSSTHLPAAKALWKKRLLPWKQFPLHWETTSPPESALFSCASQHPCCILSRSDPFLHLCFAILTKDCWAYCPLIWSTILISLGNHCFMLPLKRKIFLSFRSGCHLIRPTSMCKTKLGLPGYTVYFRIYPLSDGSRCERKWRRSIFRSYFLRCWRNDTWLVFTSCGNDVLTSALARCREISLGLR